MKKLVFRCLFLLILMLPPLVAARESGVVLKDLDGVGHDLGEYIGQGKWVLLNVWGPKCPPCVDEMSELQSFHDAHKDKDAIVVSMAIDYPSFGYANVEEVRQFVEDYFIDFTVLLGDADVVSRFGGGPLRGTPTTFMYTGDGDLAAVQVGAITQKIIEDFIAGYKPDAEKSKGD